MSLQVKHTSESVAKDSGFGIPRFSLLRFRKKVLSYEALKFDSLLYLQAKCDFQNALTFFR